MTAPATYDAAGVRTFACGQCGETRTEAIPALGRTPLSGVTVSGIAAATYTGKAIQPSPMVRLSGNTLKEGADYIVPYRDNVKVGTAPVTVAGRGAYRGSKTASFKIAKAASPMAVKAAKRTVKLSKARKRSWAVASISIVV